MQRGKACGRLGEGFEDASSKTKSDGKIKTKMKMKMKIKKESKQRST